MKALRIALTLVATLLWVASPAAAQTVPGTPVSPVACMPGAVCTCPAAGEIAGCVAATMIACQLAGGTANAQITTARDQIVGGAVQCIARPAPSATPLAPRCVKGELCTCSGELNNNGPSSIYSCVAQSFATCVATGGTPQGGGVIHDAARPGSGEFFFFCL